MLEVEDIVLKIYIAAVGFVPNTLSISYFVRIENQGLANKLMICLNLSDILSIITSIAYSVVILIDMVNEVEDIIIETVFILFNSFPVISGCIIFIITLLRTIAIYNPFYHARKRIFVVLLVSMIVVSGILVKIFWISKTEYIESNSKLFGFVVWTLSCLNIIMCTAAIIVLMKSGLEGQKDKNCAAVTMVIISAIYFTTSLPMLILQVITDHYNSPDDSEEVSPTEINEEIVNRQMSAFLIYMITLSISCLFNPLVYIFRKHQLRNYIKSGFIKPSSCFY